jgi:isoleucyl-tRNA synthetase
LENIAQLAAPLAPFYMEQLYRDLSLVTKAKRPESVHLSDFPKQDEDFIDSSLESKMQKAQTISSLILSLRKKEKIKVRQPLQRVMVPVLNAKDKKEIEAVSELIKSETNIKEIELIDDTSDILVKQAKPNFKILGPRFGKDMKFVAAAVGKLTSEDIFKFERGENQGGS